MYEYISTIIPIIAGLITTIGVSLPSVIDDMTDITDSTNINNLIIFVVIGVVLSFVIITILYFISRKETINTQ